MRQKTKKQLLSILESMGEMHQQCAVCEPQEMTAMMQECQQAAIAIGETLEHVLPEEPELVSYLEQYCERAYLATVSPGDANTMLGQMDALITKVHEGLSEVQAVYQVVFFPYKAEMWDSLESIWIACKADERCEAVVVPIPYFRLDRTEGQWIPCYDGDKFPPEVPVVPYQQYAMEQEQPELAYIHNPYDGGNHVTMVHPEYYSSNIKKYADKLVYVPYFVSKGAMSQPQSLLPAYLHMDYMIAQSEYFKNGAKGMFYYDKVLALGSPKLDRVIRMCQEEKYMPEEWKPVLAGKKILMLNTSISCFLFQEETYLKKLQFLFEWVKGQKKVALIWRPHPLLEATIRSLRVALVPEYLELKEFFEKEQVGILDTTPDITNTVALADGYIGEEESSVVNLFGAAGKPIFILNNFITKIQEADWRRKVRISDITFEGDKCKVISSFYNVVFWVEEWSELRYEGRLDGWNKWQGLYSFSSMPKGNDIEELKRTRKIVEWKDKMFFLPWLSDCIWEYCRVTDRWTKHEKCITDFKEGADSDRYQNMKSAITYCQEGNKLWIVSEYTSNVLCFDMENVAHIVYETGEPGRVYSAVSKAGEDLWLADTEKGTLIRYNPETSEKKVHEMPENFVCRMNAAGRYRAHAGIFDAGEWIITVPAFSDTMVKVHKQSGVVKLCGDELWKDVLMRANDYDPRIHPGCCFAKWMNGKLYFQRTKDDALIIFDVVTETYELYYPMMTAESYENIKRGESGFERPTRDWFTFARRESRMFSLEEFMDDFTEGRLEDVRCKQLEVLSDFANNLDGSCGEKVHAYMMRVLSEL